MPGSVATFTACSYTLWSISRNQRFARIDHRGHAHRAAPGNFPLVIRTALEEIKVHVQTSTTVCATHPLSFGATRRAVKVAPLISTAGWWRATLTRSPQASALSRVLSSRTANRLKSILAGGHFVY